LHVTSPQEAQQFIGRTAVDNEGSKVGKIGQVYVDDQTGTPLWATVATGMFGSRQSFAPLYGVQVSGDEVALAVSKEQIKDAPSVDDDGRIDATEQEALYRHYADYLGEQQTGYVLGEQAGAQGRDTSGPVTDEAMTRSEERLHVGTETIESGRARLRKYVVTENVSTTVPVSHEEVRVEREPITEANRDAALSGEPISEEEHEVTLRAERPVVAKEAVPVERVRLTTETVTEDAAVNESIRKERIEDPDVEGTHRDSGR
jgi:uncharacterized protein (TIGR02271 family)